LLQDVMKVSISIAKKLAANSSPTGLQADVASSSSGKYKQEATPLLQGARADKQVVPRETLDVIEEEKSQYSKAVQTAEATALLMGARAEKIFGRERLDSQGEEKSNKAKARQSAEASVPDTKVPVWAQAQAIQASSQLLGPDVQPGKRYNSGDAVQLVQSGAEEKAIVMRSPEMSLQEPLLGRRCISCPTEDNHLGPLQKLGRWRSDEAMLQEPTKRNSGVQKELDLAEDRFRPMFPDAEALKDRVKRGLIKPQYDVENFYKNYGVCQALVRSEHFKNLTMLVIGLNTIWIAVDTDLNKASSLLEAAPLFQVADNFFCCFFVFEICMRFGAFLRKRDAFRDGWFLFDSTLVLFMVWETWVMTAVCLVMGDSGASEASSKTTILRIFRLFRLSRVARMARLLRFMPELMVLIKGMAMAMRSVASTLCLLLIIIYVFAIFFTELLSEAPVGKGCFENVPQAMNCLLLDGVFADQAQFITSLLAEHWFYYVVVLIYLLLGSLTVMNMLIGVICEVVSVVAQVEKEEMAVEAMKYKIRSMLPQLDADGNQMVSMDEFKQLLESPSAAHMLQDVGVDVVALVDFGDFIFNNREEVSFSLFIETVLQLRGTNTATVKDVVDMRKFILRELASMESRLGLYDRGQQMPL